MLLVLCVDLDDDLGRKTGFDTPVVGRDEVEAAAVALATADPEDSDVNVMFEGVHLYDRIQSDESVEVAIVTGNEGSDISANRKVGEEVDTVLASINTSEEITTVIVTDGAQDESVIPVIRSRIPVDASAASSSDRHRIWSRCTTPSSRCWTTPKPAGRSSSRLAS